MLRRLTEGQKRNIAHWAMEFVVVLVGVLLALWLQERVARSQRDGDARAAEAAIRDEFDDNLMILVAQGVVERCQNDRLQLIEARLSKTGPAAPINDSYLVVSRTAKAHTAVYGFFALDVSDTAWQSALATGALADLGPERYRKLANLHAEFQAVQRALDQNRDATKTLQILAYGTDLSPDLRARLVTALTVISENRAYLSNAVTAASVAAEMRALGWDDKQQIDRKIAEFKAGMAGFGVVLKPCARPFANPFASRA